MLGGGTTTLGVLPVNIIEKILLQLDITDIISFGQTSSSFKAVALAELFWQRILEQRWGHLTRPIQWLSDSPLGCFELHSCRYKFPGTFRYTSTAASDSIPLSTVQSSRISL